MHQLLRNLVRGWLSDPLIFIRPFHPYAHVGSPTSRLAQKTRNDHEDTVSIVYEESILPSFKIIPVPSLPSHKEYAVLESILEILRMR